jgi:sugar/nucleoside kinase (ribokinase family)
VTVAVNRDGDRSFLSFAHPSPQPNPELVDRCQPRAVLLDGLRLGEGVIETLRRAKRIGALRLADVQDLAPTLADEGTATLLSLLDMVTLNEREALQLTGAGTVEDALDTLTAMTPLVVLKKGARGALAIAPFGRVELPAIPTPAVDLTGCGDNFFAAFTAALLAGCSLFECVAWANAAGSLAAGALGGTGKSYSRDELRALAEERYGDLAPFMPPIGVTWTADELRRPTRG